MSLVEILKVIVQGIVEGFTEWLPISSTGHMILVDEIIHMDQPKAYLDVFFVVIQLGAILAVVLLYFDKLNPFSRRKKAAAREATLILWVKIVVACIPAAVLGILFNDWMEEHLMNAYVVAAALIIYGVLFIVLENRNKNVRFPVQKTSQITFQTALYIGLFHSRYIQIRFHHSGGHASGLFPKRFGGIFFLFRNSGYAGSQPVKDRFFLYGWKQLYRPADFLYASGHGGSVPGVGVFH